MYVHAVDGSWFNHPFWRRSFLLRQQSDLDSLLDSGIVTVLIDTSRGSDTLLPAKAGASPRKPTVQASLEAPLTQDEQITAAEQVVNRSAEAMRAIFDSARLGNAIETEAVTSVVGDVAASIECNRRALLKVLKLKSKDEYTYLHSVTVCALMVNLGRQVGLDREMVAHLGTAGLLHDIGKVMIPATVLNKPGKLTDEELALVRTHSLEGYHLLSRVGSIPAMALDVCLHHHEKIDGTGYPHGLCGDQISVAARMGAICDVYDAITSNRPYKDAWSPVEAMTRMRQWSGHFDPQLLSSFMISIGVLPLGTVVHLRDDRLGVVVQGGRKAPTPRVLAFYSIPQREFIRSELFFADEGCILAEVDPAAWGIERKRIDHLMRLGVRGS